MLELTIGYNLSIRKLDWIKSFWSINYGLNRRITN